MMTTGFLLCATLMFLAVGNSHQQICRNKDVQCQVGQDQCCEDMVCKKKTDLATKTTCQPTSCRNEDEICNPDGDIHCCRGMSCENNLLGESRCRRNALCKTLNEKCTIGGIDNCCTNLRCGRKNGVVGSVCILDN